MGTPEHKNRPTRYRRPWRNKDDAARQWKRDDYIRAGARAMIALGVAFFLLMAALALIASF